MERNILKALTNNLILKLMAVFFAFTLWITVYNLEDPTKSKTLTITVDITNKDSLENMGKYFEVIEGTNRISFSVTAVRSTLDKLDESDFTAIANMDKISIDEKGKIGTVPIDISCNANVNENAVSIKSSSKEMKVALDELMTKQFVVAPKTKGKVATGYALGDVMVTAPNVLTVAGPKSMVQDIVAAVAVIDVGGMSDSWATYRVTPTLFDANEQEVDTTRLTLSNSTVNVSAEILNTKEVTITAHAFGTPAPGHVVTEIKTNPSSIFLKGDKSLLNGINSIEVPKELFSVEGASSDVSVSIDISEYIPDGIQLLNGESSIIKMTAEIGKIKNKVFSVETGNIMVTGLATNWKLEFAHSSVGVTISGLEEEILALSNVVLNGSIDVTNLSLGEHMVDLYLDIDETKYTYTPIQVMVTIKDPNVEVPEMNGPTTSESEAENTPDEDGEDENQEAL